MDREGRTPLPLNLRRWLAAVAARSMPKAMRVTPRHARGGAGWRGSQPAVLGKDEETSRVSRVPAQVHRVDDRLEGAIRLTGEARVAPWRGRRQADRTAIGMAPIAASSSSPRARSGAPDRTRVRAHWYRQPAALSRSAVASNRSR